MTSTGGGAEDDDATTTQPTPEPDGAGDGRADAAADAAVDGDADARANAAKKQRSRRRKLLEWPILIAVSLLAAFLVRTFVLQTFWIPSGSMEDTLLIKDRVLVNKLSYRFGEIGRGDVVVFERPPSLNVQEDDLIKRVIGTPGDRLQIKDGKVWVNGEQLDEPYINSGCNGVTQATDRLGAKPVTIPDGDIFVMGDNRCESYDSRFFGPIDEDLVVGRAMAVIWPLSHWDWL